jgi:hypothetical protein
MKQFFEDHTGKLSMMRLKTFLVLLVVLIVVVYQVTITNSVDHLLITELLYGSMGFKIWQNQQEKPKA